MPRCAQPIRSPFQGESWARLPRPEGLGCSVTPFHGEWQLTSSLIPPPLVEKDVAWEIGTTDAEGEFTKVATSYDGQAKFVVPAGAYQVHCIRGEATAATDVTVQSGQTVSKPISLNAAVLDLVPQTREGGQLNDISWEVFGDANGEDDRKKIATSYDSTPHLYLPAGKYLVTWEASNEKGSAEVQVAAGDAKKIEVPATR